jgi:hypothetical protein
MTTYPANAKVPKKIMLLGFIHQSDPHCPERYILSEEKKKRYTGSGTHHGEVVFAAIKTAVQWRAVRLAIIDS